MAEHSPAQLARAVGVLSAHCASAADHGHDYVSVPIGSLRFVLAVLTAPRPLLSRKQARVFDYLRTCITERGYAPAFEEIAQHLGLRSIGTVSEYIDTLEKKGYVRRTSGRVHGRRAGLTLVEPFS
jgi:hypothetical protein